MPGLRLRKNTFKNYLSPISHVCLSNAATALVSVSTMESLLQASQPNAEVETTSVSTEGSAYPSTLGTATH